MARQYESLIRTAQADATRRRIAEAARTVFLAQGWARTTIREVAATAGVSVPTVYATYGNKKGLAVALMDAADLAADPDRLLADLAAARSPAEQLAASVAFDCRLFAHSGDVLALLNGADPDLAHAAREGARRGDTARRAAFSSWPPGTLRDGLTVDDAVDGYAAICALAPYLDLTRNRGWPPPRVESWWTSVVSRELLAVP